MSASWPRMSMSLPLPSSPHWVPTTTVAGIDQPSEPPPGPVDLSGRGSGTLPPMVAARTMVEGWLATAWEQHATDVHVAVGAPANLRVDGLLAPMAGAVELTLAEVEDVVEELLGEQSADIGLRDVDFGFTWGDRARIRGNA